MTRLRATGMPISDIKRYVDLKRQGASTTVERMVLLEAHRDAVCKHLEEVSHYLTLIERKIEHYREYYRARVEQDLDPEMQ